MKIHRSFLAALILIPALPHHLRAQAIWSGAGGDNNWSTNGNWSGGTPGNSTVQFGNTDPTTQGTVNNIVDVDYITNPLASLTYSNTGTNWQVTQIKSGITLTLDAASAPANILWVGTSGSSNTYTATTNAAITGDGKLVVNESASNILVSTYSTGTGSGTTANGQALLNMSGLAEFEATVNAIRIGYGRGASATAYLAKANTISAAAITVGSAEWGGSSGSQTNTSSNLYLGSENTIYVTDLLVGSNLLGTQNKNANSGNLAFASGLAGTPTVILRGLGSTESTPVAVTNMVVGGLGGNSGDGVSGSAVNTSLADFTGGSVDALVTNLTIATGNAAPGSSVTGTLKMDDGTFEASAVSVGYSTRSNPAAGGTTTGTLEIGGGTFKAGSILLGGQAASGSNVSATSSGYLNISGGLVDVTGNITVANRGSSAANGTGEVDITGGTLKVGGNMAEGTGTNSSTVKLRGGTLDMDGGSITVDTFTVESGTLKNLAQFNSGGTITKTTAGTLILDGTNTYTGATDISAGTLLVNGTHIGGGNYSVGSTATLAGTGTITAETNANITVGSGGTLKPGDPAVGGGVGTLNISFGGTSKMVFQTGSTLSLDAGDKITFALAGNWLTVNSGALLDPTGGSWQAGVAYTLFQNITVDPTTVWALTTAATSAGFVLDTSFGSDGFHLVGNDLQVQFSSVAVPEPGTTVLLCAAGATLLLRRRKH